MCLLCLTCSSALRARCSTLRPQPHLAVTLTSPPATALAAVRPPHVGPPPPPPPPGCVLAAFEPSAASSGKSSLQLDEQAGQRAAVRQAGKTSQVKPTVCNSVGHEVQLGATLPAAQVARNPA